MTMITTPQPVEQDQTAIAAARPLPGLTQWRWVEVLGPLVVVVAATYACAFVSPGMRFMVEGALALLVMVLALQVFVGNSGVLSFGHGSFALLGGFAYTEWGVAAIAIGATVAVVIPALTIIARRPPAAAPEPAG